MTQKTLIGEPESTIIGVANVPPPIEQLPAVMENRPEAIPSTAIRDLRSGFMMMPAQQMQLAMSEAKERRDTFRDWVLSQMVEGVHFGYSPGTVPKWGRDGQPCQEKDANGTIGKSFVPLTSWRPKKSLYAAGADFVCDLLGVRDELAVDHDGWVQAGSQPGTFVVNCKLISRSTGEILANGLGLALAGGEQLGANAALKKAGKRAKVSAVLDYLGLRDLFTPDPNEEDARARVENPTQTDKAPGAAPRGKRVSPTDVGGVVAAWKAVRPPNSTAEEWAAFVQKHAQRQFDCTKAGNWTETDLRLVKQALEAGL